MTSCRILSRTDTQVFAFDRAHDIILELLFPDQYSSCFSVGDPVRLYEGGRQVGEGMITGAL